MVFITMIPTRRNDGTPVGETELAEIVRSIWERFSGASVEAGITGHWIDPTDGKHYQDENLKVTVACDDDRLPDAESIVREIGRRLDQKSMFFEVRYFDGIRFLEVT